MELTVSIVGPFGGIPSTWLEEEPPTTKRCSEASLLGQIPRVIRPLIASGIMVLQAATADATETLLAATPTLPQELPSPFQLDDVWVEAEVADGYLNPNVVFENLEDQGGSLQLNLMPGFEPVFDTLFVRPPEARDPEFGRWEGRYWPEAVGAVTPVNAIFVWNRQTGSVTADIRGVDIHYRVDSYPDNPTHVLIRRLDSVVPLNPITCGNHLEDVFGSWDEIPELEEQPPPQDFEVFCVGAECDVASDVLAPAERCLLPGEGGIPVNQDSCDPSDPGPCLIGFFVFFTQETVQASPVVFRVFQGNSFIPTLLTFRDLPTQIFLRMSEQDILFHEHNNSLSFQQDFFTFVVGWREMPTTSVPSEAVSGVRSRAIATELQFRNDTASSPLPQHDCRADLGIFLTRTPVRTPIPDTSLVSVVRGAVNVDMSYALYAPRPDPNQPQILERNGATGWAVLESDDFTVVHEIGHVLRMQHQRAVVSPESQAEGFYDFGFGRLIVTGPQLTVPVGWSLVRTNTVVPPATPLPAILTYSSTQPFQSPNGGSFPAIRGDVFNANAAVLWPQTIRASYSAELWDSVTPPPPSP